MPICPKCGSEFADGASVCADCNTALTDSVPEVDAPNPTGKADSDFVLLRGYPSRIHAEMVGEVLTGSGIGWLVKSNEMFGSGTGLGALAPTRVEIWVAAAQLETARTIADETLDPV